MAPPMTPSMEVIKAMAWATEEVGSAVGSELESAVGLDPEPGLRIAEKSAPSCETRGR